MAGYHGYMTTQEEIACRHLHLGKRKKRITPSFFTRLPVLLAILVLLGCRDRQDKKPETEPLAKMNDSLRKPRVPGWHRNATIYEVNLRIYTKEGTFRAFEKHLHRLQQMGVAILWLMPVFPVSLKNRKGKLGSPYAVADYRSVNPEFGDLQEFNDLVTAIHAAGMHCIIDWVPNHTGWDHPWITAHPDWYTKDMHGNITDPVNPESGKSWGWTDVADLDYGNREMRHAMIDAMSFWVRETGIDGFRVDVAHGVPADFWVECTDALYAIKPLFMLSEGEVPAIVNNGCFIADYAWDMNKVLNGIAESQGAAKGRVGDLVMGNLATSDEKDTEQFNALDIDRQLVRQKADYRQGYKMQFTSNHDENAWAGTEFQRFGKGHRAFAVLTATFDGMPLIYSGQEAAVDKQYAFFDKDEIPWGDYAYADFYKALFQLKHRNKALWNGENGGALVKIKTTNDEAVYAFSREKDGDRVVVILNLSAAEQHISLREENIEGTYLDVFDGQTKTLAANVDFEMQPWEYLVLTNLHTAQ
jgi:glycosidase